jgi:hypothetical protein
VNLDSTYHGKYNWLMMSSSFDALIQGEFFWMFNVYTGFSFSAGYGYLNLNVDADGIVTTTDAGYIALFPNPVDHISVKTKQKHTLAHVRPHYVLGMDIKFYLFYINIESMVDMTNGQDISVQLAFRFQI